VFQQRLITFALVLFGLTTGLALAEPPQQSAEALTFFEKQVRPLLIAKCYACHSVEKGKSKGELTLDTREGWMQGGESGPVIVPGKPDESLLIQAVRYADELKMPPKSHGGRLKDAEIDILVKWVRQGAVDPRTKQASSRTSNVNGAAWWAFQPITSPAIPQVPGLSSKNPIDAFITEKLNERGISAGPLADKRMLLRRATFDLIGLPPTLEETQAFLNDRSPDAFNKVIDRLLASPHYGEKWGRHWLDVVRYADSLDERGYDKDGDILDAWRYRDWVVNAFNRDLPYDQFITQQIAGDIVANESGKWSKDLIVATGMYAIGNWGNGDADKEKLHTDIVDDQVDVTSRAFLGVTLACARCHDHKFDPFTTKDYYGLAGFFFSSHILDKFQSKGEGEKLMRIPLQSPEEKAHQEKIEQRIKAIDAELAKSLRPFDEVKNDIAGIKGLQAWANKGIDNPSLVINSTNQPVAFGTIKMGERTVALHPGPKVPAAAAWRSPIAGKLHVEAKLRDADPNCGDGIEWEVRVGKKSVQKGVMDNGKSVNVPESACDVKKGDLILLIIGPRKDYTCDTTEVEFIIRSEDGKRWDLRHDLVSGAKQGQEVWWICSGEGERLAADDTSARALEDERKALIKESANRAFTQGLLEGGIPGTMYVGFHDAKVHVRGSYNRLGDIAPRGFPGILCQHQPQIKQGSGRLELAQWIADAKNPLTARVMANRIWQHHFGDGLVKTANNFGKLGTPPTHPELLDHLASAFVRSGWSIKAMHRLIMSSETYQRSSLPAKSEAKSDPDNMLLAQQNRRRLDAEEFRDAMLAVTKELDPALGGKAIRDLNSKRRTLYVTTIRSDRSNYQALFDAADPTAIVEKRTEATVAPQALWLMNHPFVMERTRTLAQLVVKQHGDRQGKMNWLCEKLFARQATEQDRALALRAVQKPDQAADWEKLCQVLLCSNEFIYVD
jgi:hypothetical protein